MLTFKAEVLKSKQKSDGTYNVKIRMTYNREVKRLSTNIFVKQEDLTKSFKLKNPKFIKEADAIVRYYQETCTKLQLDINHYTLDDVLIHLKGEQKKAQEIDFIQFSRVWIAHATIKGAENYTSAINSFVQFLGKDNLCINKFTASLLKGFMDYLVRKREEKVKLLMKQSKRVPSNRVVSLYLGSIRHLFNEAKRQYNDYDRDMILIPHSPFDNFKIPKQEATRKRAISAELIKKIYKLPYRYNSRGKEIKGRYNLAKDGFIMSFCLIGMNTADLYNCKELDYGVITYYRTKTTSRRNDKAKMKVKVPALIMSLFELVKMKTYISLSGMIGKFFIICIANDKFCIHEKLSILNVGSKIISAVTDSNDYYWHNLKFTIYYQK